MQWQSPTAVSHMSAIEVKMTKPKRVSGMLPMGSADLRAEFQKLQISMDCADGKLSKLAEYASKSNSSIEKITANQGEEKSTLTRIENELRSKIDEISQSVERANETMLSIGSRLDVLERFAKELKSSQWEKERAELTSLASLHPASFLEHLDCHIVDHCNLNCASCSTFSPLAEKRFASVDLFQSSLKHLHNLAGDKVIRLHLIGGEPLLHPHVHEFGRIARTFFPYADIDFTTNGLLVQKMDESFWKMMRDCSIRIKFTPYPINFDYASMKEYVRSKGVAVFSASQSPIKHFRRMPLDARGIYSAHKSYSQCPYTDCAQLIDGKLYRCPASGLSQILNNKIGGGDERRFSTSSLDYLCLDNVKDERELLSFLSRPIPFCRYCNVSYSIASWGISSKDIAEWVDS